MKSLLHAAAFVLTILLFLIKPPGTLTAVCYKRISPSYKYYPENLIKDANLSSMDETCRQAYYVPPKYKKDPEIDVDNEQIGHYPLD